MKLLKVHIAIKDFHMTEYQAEQLQDTDILNTAKVVANFTRQTVRLEYEYARDREQKKTEIIWVYPDGGIILPDTQEGERYTPDNAQEPNDTPF